MTKVMHMTKVMQKYTRYLNGDNGTRQVMIRTLTEPRYQNMIET